MRQLFLHRLEPRGLVSAIRNPVITVTCKGMWRPQRNRAPWRPPRSKSKPCILLYMNNKRDTSRNGMNLQVPRLPSQASYCIYVRAQPELANGRLNRWRRRVKLERRLQVVSESLIGEDVERAREGRAPLEGEQLLAVSAYLRGRMPAGQTRGHGGKQESVKVIERDACVHGYSTTATPMICNGVRTHGSPGAGGRSQRSRRPQPSTYPRGRRHCHTATTWGEATCRCPAPESA